MPIQKVKAPAALRRAVRRREGILDEIIASLKKLKEGEALRISIEENFPGRTPRAIYQALWRRGRMHGVDIAFVVEKDKRSVVVTRVRRRA